MSAKEYIWHNDFEGCLKRFNEASKRWRNHWFEALKIIYNEHKEWAKKYILDPIKKTVTSIKGIFCNNFIIFWNGFEKQKYSSGAYIIEMYNKKQEKIYTKIGKAKNFSERFNSYKKEKKYSGWIAFIKVLQLYLNNDEDDSLTLENNLRKLFKKYDIKGFIRNDTFTNIEWNIALKNESDNIVKLTEKFLATL